MHEHLKRSLRKPYLFTFSPPPPPPRALNDYLLRMRVVFESTGAQEVWLRARPAVYTHPAAATRLCHSSVSAGKFAYFLTQLSRDSGRERARYKKRAVLPHFPHVLLDHARPVEFGHVRMLQHVRPPCSLLSFCIPPAVGPKRPLTTNALAQCVFFVFCACVS